MPVRLLIGSISCVLVTFAVIPLAHAEDGVRLIPVTEPSPGTPPCEEFYDKWEMPGVPPVILAMGGLGREALAATDCMKKNNVAMACRHWQNILAVIDRVGPPLDESRGDVVTLMAEHDCAANASAIESDDQATPAPEEEPGIDDGPDDEEPAGE